MRVDELTHEGIIFNSRIHSPYFNGGGGGGKTSSFVCVSSSSILLPSFRREYSTRELNSAEEIIAGTAISTPSYVAGAITAHE